MAWSRCGWLGALGVAVLTLAACGSGAAEAEAPSSGPAVGAYRPAVLQTLDPTVVEGLTTVVDESLEQGRLFYVTFPLVPGAEAWTDALRSDLAPELEGFGAEVAGTDEPPYPELHVAWDLVAASPEAVGVRLVTSEVGEDDAFDGDVEIAWWDPALGAERPSGDLIEPKAASEFLERLDLAGQADPQIDVTDLEALEQEGPARLDAIAFTPDGDLFVEFDRHEISAMNQPVGLAVDPAGLLSEFGEAARAAALTPADPALAPSEPVVSASDGASEGPTSTGTAPDTDCSEQKCAALTFDDGPVSGTNDLLDMLAEKDVRVTFFTVGSNVEAHPEIVTRAAAEGHVIGNHTHDHPQLTRLSAEEIRSQIGLTNDAVEAATGVRPALLRPPYGATNDTVAGVAADLGMAQINWNVDPEDWKDRNSTVVTERVLANTRNGSIVLSHDIHETTREAYADIIDGLRADGFTLVTVPDLLEEIEPGELYFNR
jgi:peptidoglycan-N-acetylglucosamine deacetylase